MRLGSQGPPPFWFFFWRRLTAVASPLHCTGAGQGTLLAGSGPLLPRFSHNMATLFIRKMVVSAVNPLLHLSRYTMTNYTTTPRALSTLLLGPLRVAGPAGAEPSAAVASPLSCQPLPFLQQTLGFKNKAVLKKRCRDCYRVKRRGRWYIYCKTHPRHKQRQI
ncbi:large ribosomal subunit protein bL36m [Myotis daubentonii]|uniref:large ribosomal subunit protein bL36m n=1 Tax=Myotis daubentonii TaxID=98922 RepID=UPI002873BF33|nr:large ribosomal subunit protein bL36m [Myotis daubentonii]